jgi:hypothetical protein
MNIPSIAPYAIRAVVRQAPDFELLLIDEEEVRIQWDVIH